MSLFSLALRNIRRNFKDYFLYFFSMVFSIMAFYTFQNIASNSQMKEAAASSNTIGSAFTYCSGLLVFFVAIFIIYSNSFFTRKRKKEVGLYSLLGIRKRKIAQMLFYENLGMGVMALVIGVAIGTVLSQGFIKILLWLMQIDMDVSFEFSWQPVYITAIVFLIVNLYTSFQAYILIYRFKLIQLFRAEQTGEKIPKTRPVLAILGVLLLGTGYYFAYYFMDYLDSAIGLISPLIILFCTIVGTYLIFRFFSVFFLKSIRRRKTAFYNGMNIMSVSQLIYRIRGNANALGTIATLCAVTIVAVGISVASYFNQYAFLKKAFPYSYSYMEKSPESQQSIEQILKKHEKEHHVTLNESIPFVAVNKAYLYDVTKKDVALKNKITQGVSVVSYSTYQSFLKKLGETPVSQLKDNESIQLVRPLSSMYTEMMKLKEPKQELQLPFANQYMSFKVVKSQPYPIQNTQAGGSGVSFSETLVVSDNVYKQVVQNGKPSTAHVVNVENDKKSKELTAELQRYNEVNDFYSPYTTNMQVMGIMVFIGGFVGIVFLLATGSIIYFKQMAESTMDKPSYEILRKVGVTKEEIRRSIAKQVGFIFLLPLLIALLHSFFALNTGKVIFGITDVTPIFWSAGVYILIYIFFYLLTVRAYVQTVTSKS